VAVGGIGVLVGGTGVDVDVAVGSRVIVTVAVMIDSEVGVEVGLAVGIEVDVDVGLAVGVEVDVGITVGVGELIISAKLIVGFGVGVLTRGMLLGLTFTETPSVLLAIHPS
jgi:hypothetical protein